MGIEVAGFAHVNLNCRDLARSRRFYEQAIGLAARVHTDPAPQDCSAFGLSEPAQWDAWMLAHEELGTPGCALDLLQWLRPEPLSCEGAEPGRLGLRALGFEVPDPVRARERIAAQGGRVAGAEPALGFGCAAWDPEGAPLWLRPGPHARLAFVELGVSDLERSLRFYAEVLGLEAGSGPVSQVIDASGAGLRADGECRVAALALPGDAGDFRVALTRWQRPPPHGRAPRDAHRQGLYRMALLASDLDRRHAELRALGVADLSAPTWLDLGPSCPAPRCRALFFRDPDGACLELIEVPSAPT